MTKEEKITKIRQWIDPEERITVNFLDTFGLNAEVMGCNGELVNLAIDNGIPHLTQRIAVPLSRTMVCEDLSHYTRDPARPLKHCRLMLVIDDPRPPIIY